MSGAESLGVLLRAWRERALFTQEQLALRTGLGVRTIGRLESGVLCRPRSDSVRLLADALELSDGERAQLVAVATGQAGRHDVPRQLPAAPRGFVGRTDQLRRLDELVADRRTALTVCVITGTAGVGKSALALRWAHAVADEFPDGQIYVGLRGFDPSGTPVTPAEAIRMLLDAFHVAADRIPIGVDAQAGLYRSLIADRRVLLLLDNARDAEQVRPLLPGTAGCLVLVTSRDPLGGLVAAGASPIGLDVLTTGEARDLLARRLGPERVAAEPDATDELVAGCARLPLALAIVAARAALHPTFPLASLAAELDLLDAADTGIAVRAVFSWSYSQLGAAAASLFRLLGLHPGPDITSAAAASLAAVAPRTARLLLAELTRARLIVEHLPGRYTFHDLLRAYATEQAHAAETEDGRRTAVHRLLDHYLHTGYAAHRLWNPHPDPIRLDPPRPGVTAEQPADRDRANAWFTAEHAVLLAAVERAAAAGLDSHAWRLAWTFSGFLNWRGHWADWAAVAECAVAAADRLGDPTAQVHSHRMLAHAAIELGNLDAAETHLIRALDLYRRADDDTGQAHTHIALAEVCGRQRHHAEALDHARRALDLHRTTGHRRGLAHALNLFGWYRGQLGEHHEAVTHCQQALVLLQEIGDREGEATAWDCLGYAHHHLDEYDRAIGCFEHALAIRRDVGNRYYEAETLTHLADTHLAAGDPAGARRAWQQALAILDDLHHPDAGRIWERLAATP